MLAWKYRIVLLLICNLEYSVEWTMKFLSQESGSESL